ncbi:MAG: metal-dependent hydrolase [Alphaproteobacteria bacterium]|nr:metal-dependent hydrolase [Alphaproteobacteria bacterium]
MTEPAARMTVRRMRFPYPESPKAWWNPARPEFSHVVNAASLGMPYLEPYLIDTMRKAKERITDPELLKDVDLYIGQESTHFRQHQQWNKRLADLGYKAVPTMEARLKADYEAFAKSRSFAFNVAYAEGFEAMALTIGHMLVEEREHLFAGADPAVASLILWHFVEEIEHKTVTYDVFKALDGRYAWRIYGMFYAMIHIMARTRQGYRAMLIEDGRWFTLASRLTLYRLMTRIFWRLTPRILRILKPSYDPREVPDPAWVQDWWRQHAEGRETLGQLDVHKLTAGTPA